jgi:hypothetical protein
MTQPGLFTPYSTIAPLLKGQLPSWTLPEDQERIASYQAYDELYWNHNENLKLIERGTDDVAPIYVPRPRTIIETVNRYVGTKMAFTVDPEVATPQVQALAKATLTRLFMRERIVSRYNSNKRFGLIRGDWLFHLMADVTKPAGTRLRLLAVDPASYFPVYVDDDPDRLWKVHLVERILIDGKFFVKRLTYEKEMNTLGAFSGRILWSKALFEEDKWFKEGEKATSVEVQPTPLDPRITAIPVYHIPNFDEPGNPFGSSELRGFERLLAGINQSFSDEDMALALMGIGVYSTDTTARPKDARTGNEVDWTVYPGKVLQGAVNFRKIEGITSVTPYGAHISRMIEELGQASGASSAATGTVDVQVAESGVALAIHLAPMLAKAEEKDQLISDTWGQLHHDLAIWHQVYEAIDYTEALVTATFGDKLPVNVQAEINKVVAMMTTEPPIMSAKTARAYLTRVCGVSFEEAEEAIVYAERKAITAAGTPPATAPGEVPGAPGDATGFDQRAGAELQPADAGAQADAGATPGTPV